MSNVMLTSLVGHPLAVIWTTTVAEDVAVGVPVNTPSDDNAIPSGSVLPDLTANAGV